MAVTGTFSGTGQSSILIAQSAALDMTFAGTATVNLERQIDGTNWRVIETYTASVHLNIYPQGFPTRLNCTAHTNDVVYAMAEVEGTEKNYV